MRERINWVLKSFQSAPPVKGATQCLVRRHHQRFVSIRAPREGGDSAGSGSNNAVRVSIRAPREGGDLLL